MRKQILKPLAAIIGSVVLAVSMAACTPDKGDDKGGDTGSTSESGSALPPVMATVDDLADGEFTINSKQPLVVNVDDPQDWTGQTLDAEVAEFVPGSDDGTTVLNPGFKAVGPGTTTASVTSPDGQTYSFKIVVKE